MIVLEKQKTGKTIKSKEFNLKTVFLIQFFTISLCGLVFSDLQLYKLNPLFIMLLAFATEAIIWIYDKKKILGQLIVVSFSIIFIIFEIFYFKNINEKVGVGFNTDVIPLVSYLEQKYPDKEIFMETDAIQQYIYVLLATKMSPYEFSNSMQIIQYENGDTEVVKAGRYHFLHYVENKNMIYVLEENNLFRGQVVEIIKQDLESKGFSCEKYNNFLIYTYTE